MEAAKEEGIQTFLLDTEYGVLSNRLFVTVCHLWLPLFRNIPLHMPVGCWMPMHHGLCLVGGNTSEGGDNGAVGGCYNGGNYKEHDKC